MLFKVEIENFLSIAEPASIDLRARKGMDDVLGRCRGAIWSQRCWQDKRASVNVWRLVCD